METSTTADSWSQRVDSRASGPVSSASSSRSIRSLSTKWKPSWLSRSASITDSNASSGRRSTCTTRWSVSTSTASSVSTRSSAYSNTYELPGSSLHRPFAHKEPAEPYDSALDATLALATLAEDIPDFDEKQLPYDRGADKGLGRPFRADAVRCSESRATSTISKVSSNPRDLPAESAEVEMFAREYNGYWRPSFTAAIPPAVAMCGTMLLTARLPARLANGKVTSTDPALYDQACSLRESLANAASAEEAMQILYTCSIEAIIVALRSSLDGANLPVVPERPAWAIYQKIAQAKNHPEKQPKLWKNVSKLLRKIPSDQMVIIMFLLSVARRLHSRDIDIDGQSPAVYLLKKLWPRYVSEDASKLLMLYYDQMPLDLPMVLEAVNYRFSGRRCNVLALGAGIRDSRPSVERGPRGVQEMCSA